MIEIERLWQTVVDNEGTQWADDITEAAKEECP